MIGETSGKAVYAYRSLSNFYSPVAPRLSTRLAQVFADKIYLHVEVGTKIVNAAVQDREVCLQVLPQADEFVVKFFL
jgi:hypothetical protein